MKKLEKKIKFKISYKQNFIEYSPLTSKYLKDITSKINLNNGGILIIDYGYLDKEMRNTIQAVSKHKYTNILTGFSDFNHHDLSMSEQQFEDYKSKYLDLYERVKHNKENQMESILDEVDFEIELIRTDEINVAYILRLLANYRESSTIQQEKMKRNIMSIITGQEQLRSKQELIEAFIDNNLMSITDTEDIDDEFENYLEQHKSNEFETICDEENLNTVEVKSVIETYLYEQRKPLNDVFGEHSVGYKFVKISGFPASVKVTAAIIRAGK